MDETKLTLLPGLLIPWYRAQHRQLPWREDREPYHVWLSEVMLQQTRVEAVKGYYARFLSALPDIPSLASCGEDRLLKLWEGLGYYSRARNLRKAALEIMDRFGGEFPRRYEDVRSLPGIGDYTAGAICSICFGLPTPAVDGNVLRVTARLTGMKDPVTRPETGRAVAGLLQAVYPAGSCGDFTQALMELGATVCVPNGAPACGRCPLCGVCPSARNEGWRALPVREPKRPRRTADLTVLLLHCGGRYAIRRRADRGLLAGLWEFPNEDGVLTMEEALSRAEALGCMPSAPEKTVSAVHVFTHVEWRMTGHYVNCRAMPDSLVWAGAEELEGVYSLPTAFRKLLD